MQNQHQTFHHLPFFSGCYILPRNIPFLCTDENKKEEGMSLQSFYKLLSSPHNKVENTALRKRRGKFIQTKSSWINWRIYVCSNKLIYSAPFACRHYISSRINSGFLLWQIIDGRMSCDGSRIRYRFFAPNCLVGYDSLMINFQFWIMEKFLW